MADGGMRPIDTGDARTELRRRLLDVDPSGVRDDAEAAARCECACHPRPGGRIHPDGTCPCQLTAQEREERRTALEQALEAVHSENAQLSAQRELTLAQVAGELGVEAAEEVPAAPWVITGVVDGRGFYMRERWDAYSIVIAPDDRPGLDVWSAIGEPGLLVHEGTVSDLLDPGGQIDYRVALPFVVDVIRSELRRRTCPHPSGPGDQFCPRCGSALEVTFAIATTGAPARERGADPDQGVESSTETIDPPTMRSIARLSTLAEAWAASKAAEDVVVASVERARRGGDSWRVIALVLDLTAREARVRYGSRVGE